MARAPCRDGSAQGQVEPLDPHHEVASQVDRFRVDRVVGESRQELLDEHPQLEARERRTAEVRREERLRALRDAEAASGVPNGSRQWTIRPIAERAGMSGDPVAKLMRGEHVSPAMIDKLAAILPAE